MRPRFHPALVLALVLLPLGARAAGNGATVKAESAPVYADRSPGAALVKTLQKGDAVEVGVAFAGADGEWCTVREVGQKPILGYVRCEQLEREQKPQPLLIAPEAPQPAAPGSRAMPAPPDPAAMPGHFLHELWLWTGWPGRAGGSRRVFNNLFGFTPQQQAQVESLSSQMGVTGCTERMEAFNRDYGRELTHPSLNPTPLEKQRLEEMRRDFNRFAYPCMMKMQELMEQLPRLMTPEQQQTNDMVLNQYRKDLAERRRVLTSPDTFHGIY
ncbi:MAG TPA: hypothetical protein VEU62_04060 [Bryobacterales bacterium]|nr:hypothetical protein [Bryobacterales bacterium]